MDAKLPCGYHTVHEGAGILLNASKPSLPYDEIAHGACIPNLRNTVNLGNCVRAMRVCVLQ